MPPSLPPQLPRHRGVNVQLTLPATASSARRRSVSVRQGARARSRSVDAVRSRSVQPAQPQPKAVPTRTRSDGDRKAIATLQEQRLGADEKRSAQPTTVELSSNTKPPVSTKAVVEVPYSPRPPAQARPAGIRPSFRRFRHAGRAVVPSNTSVQELRKRWGSQQSPKPPSQPSPVAAAT